VIAERDNLSFSYLRRLLSEAPTSELPRMLRSLMATGDPRVIGQLVVAADHPSVTVRLELAAVIEEAGETAAVDPAVRLLSDPVASVRMAAVKAAARLKAREAVLALCELARNESGLGEGAAVKEAAVRALGEIGEVMGGTAVRTLRQVLQEGGLLAMLGGGRHRLAAAEALGRIGNSEAKEALVRGARDRRRAVRAACRRALERLCGEASDAG
jgi:HEAT repeat protein